MTYSNFVPIRSMTSRRSGRLAQRSNQKIIEDEDPIEEMMLDDTEDEEDDDDEYMSGSLYCCL